jgi:hypothetical protein
MVRTSRRACVLTILLVLTCLAALAGQASASPSLAGPNAKKAKASAPGSTWQVVASGLNNPRGLDFGPDGALYVAEAGAGGPGPCITGPEGRERCFGSTGSVTRIARGKQQRVLDGLPSVAEPGGVTANGPADVSFSGGRMYLLVGNPGGGPETRAQFGPAGAAFGRLLRVAGGRLERLADFPRFELNHNPDKGRGAAPGPAIDSNPNSVLALPGRQLVADAGGNDLLQVDRHGHISVLAVFPTHVVPAPPGIPGLPPEIEMQAVPDTVTRGPDGAYYVGELTGFPFPVGAARVWRVVPGHKPQVYARGFTNIIDLAFDGRGRLLVLEIAKNGLLSDDPTGALIRVGRDGRKQTLASDGLVTPTGLAIGPHGAFYVSNFGIFPGTDPTGGQLPGTGQVVRIPAH